jgi:hypothetical protein
MREANRKHLISAAEPKKNSIDQAHVSLAPLLIVGGIHNYDSYTLPHLSRLRNDREMFPPFQLLESIRVHETKSVVN